MTGGDEGKWWRREVMTMGVVRKGSGEEGKWWGRQVVTKGSGEEGKWWWRGVVTKGSGEEGKWWRREAVKKGSDDEGEWWRREVVRKGSGDEGKRWRREVMMKGSGDEGKWWGREVVTKGSGEEGKWWWRGVVRKGTGNHEGEWCMMLQGLCFGEEAGARNLVFFRVKWLQATMKGTSSVRRVRLRSVYRFFCRSVTVASSCFGCACVCVVIGCFGICACRSHWNGCMMLQGLCFGEEAGARNLVFFRVKWLQATMKGTSSVRRVRLRSVYRFFLPQCNGGFKLLWVCLCVRSYRVFWNLCLQIALEWPHDVARALFWGGSRSTKPCVFPCKVAAGDDERYLVCAAGAAAVGLSFFLPQCNGGFKLLWVCLCVRSYRVFWNLCLQIALEWLHDVARALFWGGSRSTKPCVFPCKVAAGDDERYLVCAAGAAAVGLSFFLPQCNGGFKLLWVCLCVGSYRVFWNLCLQIALEWLHDVARALFWGGSRSTKPCVFPCIVAAGDDERYLVCAAGAAAVGLSFFLPQCNGGFKLLWVCLCVRSYRVFWNLCLQIALEWLRQGCLPPRLHA